MKSLLGFRIEFRDYVRHMAGLPGRTAIARKHPEVEAVMIIGYAGFLPEVPWIQAFIWAFLGVHPINLGLCRRTFNDNSVKRRVK
jgi:hypothetical protein